MALITINDKEYQVEDGLSILEAVRAQGMEIPTLCYHPELSISGGCRLCLVEDLESNQLIPSCSTEVSDGLKINIDNERVERARKSVVDLLLSDHPLDCMVCEADGNCTLQDLAYKYDIQESSFGAKRDSRFEIENDNPFIVHDPDKCILCGRCIRVDNEVQCSDAIDFVNRGFTTKVGAALKEDLGSDDSSCVFCGQCVEMCPTGALTYKPSIGEGREYDLEHTETTCGYCGVGCKLDLKTRDNKVVEVGSIYREGTPNPVGESCVKGRFGYEFIDHPDRLKTPLIKDKETGEFNEASWDEALDYIGDKFKQIKQESGGDAFGALCSARCTNEENYLMQKLMRAGLGTHTIDHCARL